MNHDCRFLMYLLETLRTLRLSQGSKLTQEKQGIDNTVSFPMLCGLGGNCSVRVL